jgi:hypothetical protein
MRAAACLAKSCILNRCRCALRITPQLERLGKAILVSTVPQFRRLRSSGRSEQFRPFAVHSRGRAISGANAPTLTYTTPAIISRCSANTAFIQSMTARTQAERRVSRWTTSQ